MKRKNILLILGAALSLTVACQKDEISVFDREETGLFFAYEIYQFDGMGNYYDSLSFSFAEIDEGALYDAYYAGTLTSVDDYVSTTTERVVVLPVNTMGKTRNYPRPVKIVVDEERNTATRGVHYEADIESVVIPAGASSARLTVRLLRTPDMQEQEIYVAFKLEENEHFKLYLQERKNTNLYSYTGRQIDATRFIFTASEFYEESFFWQIYCRGSLGPWSLQKYLFMNEVTGLNIVDWTMGLYRILELSKINQTRVPYFSSLVRKALQQRADDGDPVREADGSLMQLAGAYLVDYSAYE
ncbi:MAG: DUF4843 domain-containing protein [Odoribacteraceae bacterium]|jgi:hypothetical protein|nr:DUF4843 domain-containing protein [Odoribacteraceae bacterium]